ncbi:MAG: hypothetical protein WCO55_05615 [Candidatus Falkowbacteria bacterium]
MIAIEHKKVPTLTAFGNDHEPGSYLLLTDNGGFACPWIAHPLGVVTLGPELCLNDSDILYEGYYDEVKLCREGLVACKSSKIVEVTSRMLHDGRMMRLVPHEEGFIIQIGWPIKTDGVPGFLAEKYDDWFDGKHLLRIEEDDGLLQTEDGQWLYIGDWDHWEPHLDGVIVQVENELRYYPKLKTKV